MTSPDVAARLNQSCFCIGTDVGLAQANLEQLITASGGSMMPGDTHANLFSELSVFISGDQLAAMGNVIRAIRTVVTLPAWREQALQETPASANVDPGFESAFTAYDFHLDTDGPRLIEINTNAGGALLCASAAKNLQRSKSAPVDCLQSPVILTNVEAVFVDMFVAPFRSKYPGRPLRRIAIVDDHPKEQYLYPEFLLFGKLFAQTGIDTVVADAGSLVWQDGELLADGQPVDAVYNRLTDFYLDDTAHHALRQAWLSQAVLITPHPHGHALLANKRNLVRLTDADWLAAHGVDAHIRQILLEGIPQCRLLDSMPGDWWWEHRAEWFFKPASGYGGKGTYRGSKLTRRVFNEISSNRTSSSKISDNDYIAQRFVAPSLRRTADSVDGTDLKVDLRCFVHGDDIILVAARLYQGQTTNFRTIGGGFAPVFVPGMDGKKDSVDCICE